MVDFLTEIKLKRWFFKKKKNVFSMSSVDKSFLFFFARKRRAATKHVRRNFSVSKVDKVEGKPNSWHTIRSRTWFFFPMQLPFSKSTCTSQSGMRTCRNILSISWRKSVIKFEFAPPPYLSRSWMHRGHNELNQMKQPLINTKNKINL